MTDIQLKVLNINLVYTVKHKHHNDVCPICLSDENLFGDNLVVSDCLHAFHKDCINNWLKKKYNCPQCKRKWKNLEN